MDVLFDTNNWSGFSLYWMIVVIIAVFVPWLAYRYRDSYILNNDESDDAYMNTHFYGMIGIAIMIIGWLLEMFLKSRL